MPKREFEESANQTSITLERLQYLLGETISTEYLNVLRRAGYSEIKQDTPNTVNIILAAELNAAIRDRNKKETLSLTSKIENNFAKLQNNNSDRNLDYDQSDYISFEACAILYGENTAVTYKKLLKEDCTTDEELDKIKYPVKSTHAGQLQSRLYYYDGDPRDMRAKIQREFCHREKDPKSYEPPEPETWNHVDCGGPGMLD